MRQLLVGVKVHLLREALEADGADVGLLPGVDQLVPVQLGRGREPFVTELTRILLLDLPLQHHDL